MQHEHLSHIQSDIERYLSYINPHFLEADRWRKGGWLHALSPSGEVVLHKRLGVIDLPEEDVRHEQLSIEQAERLQAHPEHLTSWQSRDPQRGRFGGAFRTADHWIFSFSGLPERWNEGLVLGITTLYGERYTPSPEIEECIRLIERFDENEDEMMRDD